MAQFINYLQALVARKDEKGAAMVEYGILIAGIAVLVMGIVFTLGGQIAQFFTDVSEQLGG